MRPLAQNSAVLRSPPRTPTSSASSTRHVALLAVKDAELAKMQQSLAARRHVDRRSRRQWRAYGRDRRESGIRTDVADAAEPPRRADRSRRRLQRRSRASRLPRRPLPSPCHRRPPRRRPPRSPKRRTSWMAALFSHDLALGRCGPRARARCRRLRAEASPSDSWLRSRRWRTKLRPRPGTTASSPSSSARSRSHAGSQRPAKSRASRRRWRLQPPQARSDTGTFEITGNVPSGRFRYTGARDRAGDSEPIPSKIRARPSPSIRPIRSPKPTSIWLTASTIRLPT